MLKINIIFVRLNFPFSARNCIYKLKNKTVLVRTYQTWNQFFFNLLIALSRMSTAKSTCDFVKMRGGRNRIVCVPLTPVFKPEMVKSKE